MPGPSAPGLPADRGSFTPPFIPPFLRPLVSAYKGRRPATASRKRATYSQSGSLTQENSWIRLQQKSRTRQMNPCVGTRLGVPRGRSVARRELKRDFESRGTSSNPPTELRKRVKQAR